MDEVMDEVMDQVMQEVQVTQAVRKEYRGSQARGQVSPSSCPPSPTLGAQRQWATRMQGSGLMHAPTSMLPSPIASVSKDERKRLKRLETAARAPGPFAYLYSRLVVLWS